MLVYFGFTLCPDVCPTDLMAMGQAIDKLGVAGDAVQPLFVTVDPERDTPTHLADSVSVLPSAPDRPHRRCRANSGRRTRLRVYYAKVDLGAGAEYTVDHSGFIYLMDRNSKYLGFFPPGTPVDRMAAVLKTHLSAQR